jgi:hypothetical protein
LSEDLSERRIAGGLRLICFGKRFGVMSGDGQDAGGTEMQRRRQWGGEANATVTVPVPVEANGGKQDR